MEAFFEDLLEQFTGEHFLQEVCRKYHYQNTEYESLSETAERMLPLMREQACWNHRLFALQEGRKVSGKYADAAITLGEGIDRLQEEYMEAELLSACYRVETLAGELLLRAYPAYNRRAALQLGLHVARLHFPGSEEAYPVSMLPEILKRLEMPVSCNAAFCMLPKKSVVFVAELTEDASVNCPGICLGCRSAGDCPNRADDAAHSLRLSADLTGIPLNYGYTRIFGKR